MYVELYDRQLKLISAFVGDVTAEIIEDTNEKRASTLNIMVNSVETFEANVTKNDFILVEELGTFGMIESFTLDSNRATIKYVTNFDTLEHDVFVQTGKTPVNQAVFISNALTSQFITNPFVADRLPLQLNVISTIVDTLIAPDGVLAFSTLCRQVLRKNNLQVNVSIVGNAPNRKINVDIVLAPFTSCVIDENGGECLQTRKKLDSEEATRMTVRGLSADYRFYLRENGRVTDNASATDILPSAVDRKVIDEEVLNNADALAVARQEIERTYNNYIEVTTSESFFNSLALNSDCRFLARNGTIVNTKVSQKTRVGKSFVFTLGTAQTRLTDKLRKLVKK